MSGTETESVVTKIGCGRVDWARPATGRGGYAASLDSDTVQAEAP